MDLHRLAEERSIALHGRIAELLLQDPGIIDKARARVSEWRASGQVATPYIDAWERLLGLPADELCERLVDPSEQMRALRQVTPFAGALSPKERWRIRKEVAERLTR